MESNGLDLMYPFCCVECAGDFCTLMGQLDSGGASSEDLTDAFKQFDRDGSGTLPGGELRYILTNMGEVMTDEDCNDFFRQAGFKGVCVCVCVCVCTCRVLLWCTACVNARAEREVSAKESMWTRPLFHACCRVRG